MQFAQLRAGAWLGCQRQALAEGLSCRPRPRRPAPSAWIDLHVNADLRVILQRMAESRARMFSPRVEAASFALEIAGAPGRDRRSRFAGRRTHRRGIPVAAAAGKPAATASSRPVTTHADRPWQRQRGSVPGVLAVTRPRG